MSPTNLRFLADPSTVNFGGKVHSGTVMKWIDKAGCATRWAKRYCLAVFAAVDAGGKAIPATAWPSETLGGIALAQHAKAHLDGARSQPPRGR